MISPEQSKELSQRIEAARAKADTDTHRMDPVDDFLAGLVGLDAAKVRSKVVSKAGNLNVRFHEPGAVQELPLALALLTDGDLRGSVKPAKDLVRGGEIGTIALATEDDRRWKVSGVIGSDQQLILSVKALWPDCLARSVPHGSVDTDCFDGLSPGAFAFQAELAENNTKKWFDANKDRFKELVDKPLRCLLGALGPLMLQLGPFETNVAKAISRTRHQWEAKEGPYRTHYWAAFTRPNRRKQDDYQMFVTISPNGLTHGLYCGEGDEAIALRNRFRELVENRAEAVLEVIRRAQLPADYRFTGKDPDEPNSKMETIDDLAAWAKLQFPRIYHRHLPNDPLLVDPIVLVSHIFDDFSRLYAVFVMITTDAKDPIEEAKKFLDARDKDAGLSWEQLVSQTSLEEADLERIERALTERRQIVLQGPPGTGKTFVALRFAAYFAKSKSRVEIVQFHPSYSYEDFIEGIRAKTVEGKDKRRELDYGEEPGIFKKLCSRARLAKDLRFVLVIDEVNRGNVPRIFGELLLLLEYRDRQVHLAYSGNEFDVPENVYIIATMNTADRSIALVDFALRRRFSFIEMSPDKSVLERWLTNNDAPERELTLKLYDIVDLAIQDADYKIGQSHFMKKHTKQSLRDVWDLDLRPHLREYFFATPTKIEPIQKRVDELLPPAPPVVE